MKSKERVAQQGVTREGKVGERIKCVCLGGGGVRGERKKNKSVYFTVNLLSRIF